jgi:UDP-glucose 4-epimerase
MANSSVYLVTGGAGFIGSHVAERLLDEGHRVRVFDNFSTGSRDNLAFARGNKKLEIIRGDLRNAKAVERAVSGVTAVFHQAAMRSVPRSVADPLGCNAANITGTLHVLYAAAQQKKKPRVVYASSSSVYGENPDLPKRESQPTAPISPYAATKVAGEIYASVWSRLFGVETVGLRYFNVFGPRQDPKSEYAAVIPRFILWGVEGKPLQVHGDGTQTRDFTYVANVVDGVLRACEAPNASGEVINVATEGRISLNDLVRVMNGLVGSNVKAIYKEPRAGDVHDSQADIAKAERLLGYKPTVSLEDGLKLTLDWFRRA